MNQKLNALIFLVVLSTCGIIATGHTHQPSGVKPHYHDDTTTRSVPENAAQGTNIGEAVWAHNIGTYGRYRLSGPDARLFNIDNDNGQLKTKIIHDYELENTYTVTVTAQFGDVNPASDFFRPIVEHSDADSITVTINITDVVLQFNDGDRTIRSVAENMPSNTNVDSPVSASNFNSNLDLYLLAGTDADLFTIEGSTGQLKTKATFDYEVKNSYSGTVMVNAGQHPTVEDSISVAIWITDGPDTRCPPGYVLYNNDCSAIASPGFGDADPLPAISSEEAARIAQSLAMDKVIFNELHNGATDMHDWVELRNISGAAVNLDNWQIILATSESTVGATFPVGTVLPTDGLLLLANTDFHVPGMPLSGPEGASYSYFVDEGLILPSTDFTLLLRSDLSWEDAAGNYFFGYRIPPTVPPLTPDVAWYRSRPDVLGTRSLA